MSIRVVSNKPDGIPVLEKLLCGRGKQMLVNVEVYHGEESWCARGISEDVSMQGATVDELKRNIKEAAAVHFEQDAGPKERRPKSR